MTLAPCGIERARSADIVPATASKAIVALSRWQRSCSAASNPSADESSTCSRPSAFSFSAASARRTMLIEGMPRNCARRKRHPAEGTARGVLHDRLVPAGAREIEEEHRGQRVDEKGGAHLGRHMGLERHAGTRGANHVFGPRPRTVGRRGAGDPLAHQPASIEPGIGGDHRARALEAGHRSAAAFLRSSRG